MASTEPAPAIDDYRTSRDDFDWETARQQLDGLPNGQGINIGHEAVDRHVKNGRADKVAIRWIPKSGEPVDFSYADLQRETNRFANALRRLAGPSGDPKGIRVATLAGRVPELYIAVLGTLKVGGVFTPLFSAFGPEPIRQRIDLGAIDVLVTTPKLYERRVAPIRDELESLRHVILIGDTNVSAHPNGEEHPGAASDEAPPPAVIGYDKLLNGCSDDFEIPPTSPDHLALLHFTSGTTGTPKGAMHVHDAVVAHHMTGSVALDLHADDVFWCTADPGWVTGTSYGIISPLTHGLTSIVFEGEFDADRWYQILDEQQVTVWYTAPTAIRMLMRVGTEAIAGHDLSNLRVIASVGEPLNPEAVKWGYEAFDMPILDNWWQTETGGIMIANYRSQQVKPGSMGRPMLGIDIAILERGEDGKLITTDGSPVEITEPDKTGELAIRAGWPSMFRGYLGMDERYQSCFVDGWYRSGDLARRDSDGYYWFVGRGDDVIKTAGHLVGPFEVESVLMEHPAVAEAGVIGIPNPAAGEVIKAFISLAPGFEDSDELRRDVKALARKQLGAAVAPREIEVQQNLPKTRSGKIMRRLLKARELGLPEGDLSTLERPSTDPGGTS